MKRGMLKKLTLTIEESIIRQAKTYARKKKKSVSRIVEEYLRNLSSGGSNFIDGAELQSPITDTLTGMFADTGKDYKKLLEEALQDKYL
jgi:hypothetical protein